MLPVLSLLSLFFLPLLAFATPALLSDHEYAAHFADWMTEHNVAYSTSALATKFGTFKANHAYVTQHNTEAAAGLHSYTLALNRYADLSGDEYRALLGYVSKNSTGHKFRPASTHMMKLMQLPRHHSSTGGSCPSVQSSSSSSSSSSSTGIPLPAFSSSSSVPAPAPRQSSSTAAPAPAPSHSSSTAGPTPSNGGVDWRNSGMIGPVEDQGQCGGCWSFASTATMEGAWAQKTGTLYQFSEQQLIDCVNNGQNTCDYGGSMYDTYSYFLTTSGGQKYPELLSKYAYTASSGGGCQYSQANALTNVKFSSYVSITTNSETALATASNSIAAIAVAIDASSQAFQFYSTGVLTDTSCGNSEQDLDHAVTVVGYGTTGGQDYWIVKNSWGTSWGMDGYLLMRRNYNNMCGIATDASYIVA